jgi:uncharacterized linocin/CFP29 family protein
LGREFYRSPSPYSDQRACTRLVDGDIIWVPAITGASVLTTRGGDFGLYMVEVVTTKQRTIAD